MSHFYNVKNLWKPHRKPAPIGQKFNSIAIDFLQYKNGSKIFYDLLKPIPNYTKEPQIFKKIVIALIARDLLIISYQINSQNKWDIVLFHWQKYVSVFAYLQLFGYILANIQSNFFFYIDNNQIFPKIATKQLKQWNYTNIEKYFCQRNIIIYYLVLIYFGIFFS